MTSIYEKALTGELDGDVNPGDRRPGRAKAATPQERIDDLIAADLIRGLHTDESLPLRVPPKVIRIWIAPWEDGDGDLHQPEYIYSEISDKRGRWLFGEKADIVQPAITPVLEKSQEPNEDEQVKPKKK
jgi:conjugal transfer pilus assembly protein TraV